MPAVVTKWRALVVAECVVEADTAAEAEALAMWEVDNGLEQVRGVQVEELGREREDG